MTDVAVKSSRILIKSLRINEAQSLALKQSQIIKKHKVEFWMY